MEATNAEKKRAIKILQLLEKEYPNSTISLNYANAFELLIATILSAQTTDAKVNQITPRLFKRFPTPESMANAPLEELEKLIKEVNFYRNKAKFLKESAKIIVEKHNGQVPRSMNELIRLKGVARKTANVVLWHAFETAEGIAVDTHVKRIAPRLGLTKHNDPKRIEKDLMNIIPKEYWGKITHLLIDHGRKICKPKKPLCHQCILNSVCPSRDTYSKK